MKNKIIAAVHIALMTLASSKAFATWPPSTAFQEEAAIVAVKLRLQEQGSFDFQWFGSHGLFLSRMFFR